MWWARWPPDKKIFSAVVPAGLTHIHVVFRLLVVQKVTARGFDLQTNLLKEFGLHQLTIAKLESQYLDIIESVVVTVARPRAESWLVD